MIRDLSRCSAIGYVRVSLERQAGEKLTSLDDQRAAISALAAKLGHTHVEFFTDAGASGGTMERPAMLDMLASCQAVRRPASSPGLLLVLNASRWSRTDDPDESAGWRLDFRRLGWIVRYVENDDIDSVSLRHVMRAMGEGQSLEYRQQIKNNTRRGCRGASNQGFWRGRAPFGYRRAVVFPLGRERVLENGTPKAPDEKVVLVVHADEGKIVQEIFRNYSGGGHSFETLARTLRAVAPRIKWCASIVGSVLRNPAYVGDVVGGRKLGGGRPGNGRYRPESEWYGKPDAHEALVDRATWAAVQSRLGENGARRNGVRSCYVVSGLVHCATCGRPMVGGGWAGVTKHVARGKFYRCSAGLWQKEICPGKSGCVMQHLLEGAVISTIGRVLRQSAAQEMMTNAIDSLIQSRTAPQGDTRALESAYQTATARRDRLVAAVASGTLLESEAAPQMATVRAEIDARDADRQRARFPSASGIELLGLRDKIVRAALDFPALAKRAQGPELRELLRIWIAGATFDKVGRYLTVHVRCLPAIGSLHTNISGARIGPDQVPTITRRVRVGGRR